MPPVFKVGVLGVPLSKGQPRDGTENGPKALRNAGIIKVLEDLGNQVIDHGDLQFETIENDNPKDKIKNPKTVGAANKKISDAVYSIVKSEQLCLTMGGDHSMAMGSIHGHALAEPNIVVVWVDAHADINTPLTSSSGNIHGMPLSFVSKELEAYVPKLKGFEWCFPCISVKDIVYIGLRDVDEGERCIIEHFGIAHYSMQDVDRMGIGEVVDKALKAVDPTGTRPIHLSFDVDALDPAITPSTGTPVAGGLSFREGQYIMEVLANTGRLSVVDIAEINTTVGNSDVTVKTAVEIVKKCFGQKRGGNFLPSYGLPKAN
ncbi:hypothetical protein LOTGIDRAFT_207734 [Lottia gigantea]|uniref:Arginase n=1 Tax=Lottia gigantea TaxID=225164 RepID=V4AAL6_LOTGI|nr:hypothetical protein LOTGIDRAFT_207734 [Lottia gigantea]ESP01024.1 hypothetical protein LOTGIDRAFT_207734 [Lottia gigantea]